MKQTYIFLILLISIATACTVRVEKTGEITGVIQLDPEHQKCESDDDCSFARTKCSQCECYGTPINKDYEEQYRKEYAETCKGFNGPQCDMMCAEGQLKCIDGKCAFAQI